MFGKVPNLISPHRQRTEIFEFQNLLIIFGGAVGLVANSELLVNRRASFYFARRSYATDFFIFGCEKQNFSMNFGPGVKVRCDRVFFWDTICKYGGRILAKGTTSTL